MDTGRCDRCGEYRYWCRNLGCVEGLELPEPSEDNQPGVVLDDFERSAGFIGGAWGVIGGAWTGSDRTEDLSVVPSWCVVCGVPDWLNPVEDHQAWTGHPWTPSVFRGRAGSIWLED